MPSTRQHQKGESLLTTEQLTEWLNIPKTSVYTWTRTSQIPHFKVGRHLRFRREDVQEWLSRNQRGAH
jgi:excisionase family DNA binding protein